MPYKFQPNRMYRMPTHFGPACGPRQGPDGSRFPGETSHDLINVSVRFLSNREQLEALLPGGGGLALDGEPVVNVFAQYMKQIDWLAGRGYNVVGVTIPVVFHGKRDHAVGNFMIVLWENLTDPILTGRDELGAPKIYGEIPDPVMYGGKTSCTASWLGFRFFDMTVQGMKQLSLQEAAALPNQRRVDGTIWYKYIPKTGDWGKPDVTYVTLCPAAGPIVQKEYWQGEGKLQFHHARWEDMPTQFNIVNGLADLEIKEYRGATIVKSIGQGDLRDTRILE